MRRAHWYVPESLTGRRVIFSTPSLNLSVPSLVAIAVGCDVFRPDARTLIDALINIQSRLLFQIRSLI